MQASRRKRTGESLPSNRTQVPKLLMSVSTNPLLRQSMRACRRDTRGSLTTNCASPTRPRWMGSWSMRNMERTSSHASSMRPKVESGRRAGSSAAGTVRKLVRSSCQSMRWTIDISVRPRMLIGPRSRCCTAPSCSCWITASVTQIWPGPARSLRREARLTASPKQSPSTSTTSPLATPICSAMRSGTGQPARRFWW
ncbi:hypothetical protein D3C72_1642690 [compost metagenome]